MLQQSGNGLHRASAPSHMQHETVANLFRAHIELDGEIGAVEHAPCRVGEIHVWKNLVNPRNHCISWAKWTGLIIVGNVGGILNVSRKVLDADIPAHGAKPSNYLIISKAFHELGNDGPNMECVFSSSVVLIGL